MTSNNRSRPTHLLGGDMAAYVIYQGDVLDPVRYDEYTEIREGAARARMYVVDGIT